jgi:glycosyltransferase involved in cell wall biosynthesis
MSGLPLVSVVTPTYNQDSFLRATIDSVLAQDYPRVEYRIVNDGSTDSTEDVLYSYGDRIKWETQCNQGQTAAINTGWRKSAGDILAWLNSDDTLLPGAIQSAVAHLKMHPEVAIVYGQTVFVDARGEVIDRGFGGRQFDYLSLVRDCENPIPQPSTFIRRRVLTDVGPLDESLYYFMDWDYWLRTGARHEILFVPEVWSTYRLHEESKTVAGLRKAAPELEGVYTRFFEGGGVPEYIRGFRRQSLCSMYFTTAGYFIAGRDQQGARRAACKAVRTDARCLLSAKGLQKVVYSCFALSRAYVAGRQFAEKQRLRRQFR